ncbi:variant surface glycoprotein (VSG, atypical), putative [Trypanosoma brucei brucei TREU927]|uniref:Variant surface glycoprotein (VSG, atypical), putative n=1 Tax=Trypanosoma brucei brucei (strain 927/4 GUTat10.1) TaxID=185431 RepID=Q380V6_TRYB2|nr:variant surface glycoprotein [Trypanosoma brucei brucei TREU927]EAN80675.1 variant surface glycoprotein (VSG, atypical), putative [Trypanosoma brucei brucei TREU927]
MLRKVATIIEILAPTADKSAAAANDNAIVFDALSAVISIASSPPDVDTEEKGESVPAILEIIKQLNLSVAPESFYKLSFEQKPDEAQESKHWKGNRDTWEKNKKLIDKGDTVIDEVKLMHPGPSHERNVAATIINRTLELALEKQKELKPKITATAIKDLQNKVLFGESGALTSDADKPFPSTGDSACGGSNPTSQNSGASLAADFVCLCAANGGNGEECTGANVGASVQYTNPNAAATAYGKLLEKCPKAKGVKFNAAAAAAARATFLAALKKNGKNTQAEGNILGAEDSKQCNGGAQGLCVYYKPTPADGHTPIPWLEALETAEQKVEEAKTNALANGEIYRAVVNLKQTALSAYLRAISGDAPLPVDSAQTAKPSGSETEKCDKLKKKKDCEENGCQWEGKECKESSFAPNKKFFIFAIPFVS